MNGSTRSQSFAIIGAGISGLTAGNALQRQGIKVTVFEKSRGAGGRSSTRRHDALAFDHGAQYFTARGSDFRRQVDRWLEDGTVEPWGGRIVTHDRGSWQEKSGSDERFVGVPGMSALGRALADNLDVRFGTRVERVERKDGRWELTAEGEAAGSFDGVVIATPSVQAVPLLAAAPGLAERAADRKMLPCWAAMAAFEKPLALPFDGAFVEQSPLSWIARNASKPGRPSGECWVLHASPSWSSEHLEADAEEVVPRLLRAFSEAVGIEDARPFWVRGHRWRYAMPDMEEPLEDDCLWDADLRIGACGDWCAGARVEGACQSGSSLARRVF